MKKLIVCHIISGDLWAGAEVQAATLMRGLAHHDDIELLAIVLNNGKLANELKNRKIETYVVDEKKNFFIQLLWKIFKICRHRGIHILHTHRYKEDFIGTLMSLLLRIPFLVCTQHGLPEPHRGFNNMKMKIYLFIDSIVFHFFADKVICVSKGIQQYYESRIGRKKVALIYNAIDLDYIQRRKGAFG